MQCTIAVKQPNQLTNCEETKKSALKRHTVRAKEKPQFSNGSNKLAYVIFIQNRSIFSRKMRTLVNIMPTTTQVEFLVLSDHVTATLERPKKIYFKCVDF